MNNRRTTEGNFLLQRDNKGYLYSGAADRHKLLSAVTEVSCIELVVEEKRKQEFRDRKLK